LLDILQTKPDGVQRVVLIDFPHTEMKSIALRDPRAQGTGSPAVNSPPFSCDHAESDLGLPGDRPGRE